VNFKSFLDFVEIKTKVASFIPFLLGTLFALNRFGTIKPLNTLFFFISLITLDMATTAINHYEGFRKGEDFNPLEERDIPKGLAAALILFLLAVSVVTGLLLVLRTDFIVLFIGIVSMGIAILYSFGPVPISGTPYGEVVSGGLMGFVIFFVALYIQVFDGGFFLFTLDGEILSATINLKEFFAIFLVSLPLVFMIANIMLANNICDLDSDRERGRYTLPHYLGRKASVNLWVSLYGLTYLVIVFSVFMKLLPLVSLLILISLIPNWGFIRQFREKQDKRQTFVSSIKVFLTISGLWILSFILQKIIKEFL